jgi:hypothetical protein
MILTRTGLPLDHDVAAPEYDEDGDESANAVESFREWLREGGIAGVVRPTRKTVK